MRQSPWAGAPLLLAASSLLASSPHQADLTVERSVGGQVIVEAVPSHPWGFEGTTTAYDAGTGSVLWSLPTYSPSIRACDDGARAVVASNRVIDSSGPVGDVLEFFVSGIRTGSVSAASVWDVNHRPDIISSGETVWAMYPSLARGYAADCDEYTLVTSQGTAFVFDAVSAEIRERFYDPKHGDPFWGL